MKMLILASIALALLSGCTSDKARMEQQERAERRAQNDRAFAALSVEEFSICESVFRHQFVHNASSQQDNAPAYFITIYANDPPPVFLDRLHDVRPRVRAGSEFKVGHGLHFGINAIKVLDETNAEVSGGYYEANLSSSGNTYYVEKKDGSWIIVRDEMQWISSLPNKRPEPMSVLRTAIAHH